MSTIVVVEIGGERHAVAVEAIVEVVRLPAWRVPSGLAPGVLGVIDVRGTAVPLIDVRHALYGRPRAMGDGDVLLLGDGALMAAGLVDAVVALQEATEDPLHNGLLRDEHGQTLLRLDAERILALAAVGLGS